MARYFVLVEHTDYVSKNKLTAALQKQFLKLNKTVIDDLQKSIQRFQDISKIAHNLHPKCKELHFEIVTKQEGPGMEGGKYNDAWCGHWGVAIAKFFKIREEVHHG